VTFRIEEKIPISSSDMITLYENLINDGMKPLFKQRKIYSTYFETINLNMFNDSLEGVLPRKKIRVRHYPGSSLNYSLEIKYSSIEGRFKKSDEISISDHKKYLKNGIFDSLYGICIPLLEVIYEREYFQIGGIRLTFDKNIIYRSFQNRKIQKVDDWSVVEIKAPVNISIDYLNLLISTPRKRFSKFSNGISIIEPTFSRVF
jgi:hypothetical protein